jgi:hypothetical protein
MPPPGAATEDPAGTGSRDPCGIIRRCAGVISMPTIFYPFIKVTMHLVETPGIGLERFNRNGLLPIAAF